MNKREAKRQAYDLAASAILSYDTEDCVSEPLVREALRALASEIQARKVRGPSIAERMRELHKQTWNERHQRELAKLDEWNASARSLMG